MAFGGSYNKDYGQNVTDIRSEPNSVPVMLMSMGMEVFRNVSLILQGGKLTKDNLLSIKYQLRCMHSFTRTRSHVYYNKDWREIWEKIRKKDLDRLFWENANKDSFLSYLDLLMEWFDLEITLFERFNLIPAEDEEIEWPEIDFNAIGLGKYV
jgi:hypothetical protein